MENVGMFYDHLVYLFYAQLVYFMDIWYILWSFGIFCGRLVYFSRFGLLYQKNLATLLPTSSNQSI
jgi:hypothetical protein